MMPRNRVLSVWLVLMLLVGSLLPYSDVLPGSAWAETAQQAQETPEQEPTTAPEPTAAQEEASPPPEPAATPTEASPTPEPAATQAEATPTPEPAVTQAEATPTPEATAEPDQPELAAQGYAAVLADDSPVYEQAGQDSSVLAYLHKKDIVYVSDRIFKDADNPDNDWLLCRFDTSRGVLAGYLRARQVSFLTQAQTEELLLALDGQGGAAYAGHPLAILDCEFPQETSEPTQNPGPEACPEPSASPSPLQELAAAPVPVTSITLDAAKLVLMAGARHGMSALVEPADASDPSVLWSSSDESVLLIGADGVAAAVSQGFAVITATAADGSGISAQCAVTVAPPIATLEVAGKARIQVGKTYLLTARDKGMAIDPGLLAWSSSDSAVAAVDAAGNVTGAAPGTAVITASTQGSTELKAEYTVEVLRATTLIFTDSSKQFSIAVSKNNREAKTTIKALNLSTHFGLMRLILKTDGAMPQVDEYNPDIILGNKDSRYVIQFTSAQEAEAAYEALKKDDSVEYVVPEGIVRGEGSGGSADYTYNSWGVAKMHADTASEGLAGSVSGSVTVGVLDSGISAHSFIGSKRRTGYDYVDGDYDPSDELGHGTHVAGTIVDLTQALNVYVKAYRVINASNWGYYSDVVDAIRDAADDGCKVINLSFGGDYDSDSYTLFYNAISYATGKGTVVSISAGNSAKNTSDYLPACITVPGSLIVAAVNSSLNRSSFSNYGSSVDVAAPGEDIKSCWYTGGYTYMDGTSMAAPHISAACAMIELAHPGYSASQVESTLKGLCSDLGSTGYDTYYGYGLPNLASLAPPKYVSSYTFTNLSPGYPSVWFKPSQSGSMTIHTTSTAGEIDWGVYRTDNFTQEVSSYIWRTATMSSSIEYRFCLFVYESTPSTVTVTFSVPVEILSAPSPKPDLIPTEITFDRTNIAVGKPIAFDTGVTNSGTKNSGSFHVAWKVDDVRKAYGSHNGVSAGATVMNGNSQFQWTPTAAGNYIVDFTVDCDDGIIEKDEFNNATHVVVCVPVPPPKPNLIPKPITYGTVAVAGRQITFDTGITNTSATASGAFKVKWYVGSVQKSYGSHNAVPGNTTVMNGNSQFKWTPPSAGTYTITFKVDADNQVSESNESDNTVSLKVTVKPKVTKISLSAAKTTIATGKTVTVKASVSPSTAIKTLNWTSSNSKIAKVSSAGVVTGVSAGTATITAAATDGSGKKASIRITVYQPVTKVTLSAASGSLPVRGRITLKAKIAPSNATYKTLTWKSSNTKVATVSTSGVVSAVGVGTAVITVRAKYGATGNELAQYTLTVYPLTKSIALYPSSLTLYAGESLIIIRAIVSPGNASTKLTWTSSNTKCVKVYADGTAFALAPGTVVITAAATDGSGKKASVRLKVLE